MNLNTPFDPEIDVSPLQWRTMLLAVEHSPMTVLVTDSEGRIEYANPRLTELTGYTLDEVKGQTPSMFKSGHTPPETYEQLWKAIKNGHEWRGQFINRKKDGSLFWEDIRISPVLDDSGVIQHFVAIKEDITARKVVEQRLQESLYSLNRSQALAHVGDWTWDTQTNTVRWSDEMYRIFGIDQASFTGDLNAVIEAAIHPDDRSKVYAANQAVVDEHRPDAMEYRVVWPDGSVRYIWAQPGDTVLDQQGNILSLSGIVQDITDRKLAEMHLYETERFAHATLDALSAEIAILDETGTIIAVNEAWRAFASANAVDTTHMREGTNYLAVTEAVDPDSDEKTFATAFAAGIRSVMNGEEDEFSLEYPCHSPTEKRWFIGRVTRFGGDGPLRLVIAHENITELKLAELATQEAHEELARLHETVSQHNVMLEQTVQKRTAQLRRLNDRTTTILNHISDAIVLLDHENKIEITNPSFARLFGYASDELFGQHLYMIADPTSVSELIRTQQSVRDTHEVQRVQINAQSKNGRTFDADIALAYINGNGEHLVCSIRDITYLKEVDRAKDAFLAMVSHELKNPITGIILNAEMLSHFYDRIPEEKRLQKIAQIQQQANVLTELVTTILDTARYNSRQRPEISERIDIQQVADEVVAELLPQAETNEQRIEWRGESSSVLIPAERADIARIWRNLIGNAIKYSGKGSTIQIQLYSPDKLASQCDLEALNGCIPSEIRMGKYMLGMVSDDGPGIPEQDLSRLFTRFFRGWANNTKLPGTGLGLSLVKDIVQSYGGDVAAHSIPGSGTTFCFWLPL